MGNVVDFPKNTSLSFKYQKILQKQVINEDSPGSVLRDFETFLKFIGPKGCKLTNKTSLLALKSLGELNSQLTRPLKIGLKRPMQKAYPHINGLYLLVRASGLARVEGVGAKKRLVLDSDIHNSWKKLNLTERYFTLAESWLIRGKSEILGEYKHSGMDFTIAVLKNFFEKIPSKGLKLAGDSRTEDHIHLTFLKSR
ncbi:hypothetical protein [Desulfonema magnum]|uniref:Uncharacterized protein n=1 Tax=Desulfonema magnum TaxID=45655 RepID=A0A975BGZ1_9BACT|nr:hypothetical protein [Desulfonema magnum]QTA85247.1 Uncharacterized protein dnm_012520 [Desulfonema magnum]